jgi:ketosteroid isomerase-like protein
MHLKGRAISILRRQSEGSWKFARGINNMLRQETSERQ